MTSVALCERRTLTEVDLLRLDIPSLGIVRRIGLGAVALRHTRNAEPERHVEEHREAPQVDELVAMEKQPVDDEDPFAWPSDRGRQGMEIV